MSGRNRGYTTGLTRAPGPTGLTSGLFDLYDAGAGHREQEPAVGALIDLAEIEDGDAGER